MYVLSKWKSSKSFNNFTFKYFDSKKSIRFFKKNIDNSYEIRNKIEENINKIINELKEKEESLKN